MLCSVVGKQEEKKMKIDVEFKLLFLGFPDTKY